MANASTDWPFWLTASLLGGLSLIILYRALFRDRSRGRKRCPKCWYDMSGADPLRPSGLVCPECGRDAKRESALLRTRRRWGWVAIGSALALGSYGVWKAPEVDRHGWPRTIPTWALIAALDALEAPTLQERDAMSRNLPTPLSKQIGWDLITRCANYGAGMWRWERAWLIRRCLGSSVAMSAYGLGDDQDPFSIQVFCLYSLNGWGVGEDDLLPANVLSELRRRVGERAVVTRRRWPEGVPVQIKLARDTWFGYGNVMFWEIRARSTDRSDADWLAAGLYPYSGHTWNDTAQLIGDYPRGAHTVEFEAALVDLQPEMPRGQVRPRDECWVDDFKLESKVWESTTSVTFEVGGAMHDLVTATPNEAVAARIATAWQVRLDRQRRLQPSPWDFVRLNIWDHPYPQPFATVSLIPNTTLALWIEIQRNGRTVGWTQAWWRDAIMTSGYEGLHDGIVSNELLVEVISDEMFLPDQPDDSWTIRVWGDAETALRDFESDCYWEGYVERSISAPSIRVTP